MISSKSLHLPINSVSLWGACSPLTEYHIIPVGQTLDAWLKDMTNPATQKSVGQMIPGWEQMCIDTYSMCNIQHIIPLACKICFCPDMWERDTLLRQQRKGVFLLDTGMFMGTAASESDTSQAHTHGISVRYRLDQVSMRRTVGGSAHMHLQPAKLLGQISKTLKWCPGNISEQSKSTFTQGAAPG